MANYTIGAVAGGIGGALSRYAERRDMDRRAQEEFDRKKDFFKYQLAEEELAARAALAEGGSARQKWQMDREGYAQDQAVASNESIRRYRAELDIAEEAAQRGGQVVYNVPGDPTSGINYEASGSEVQKMGRERGTYQFETAQSWQTRKGGPGVRAPSGAYPDGGKAPAKGDGKKRSRTRPTQPPPPAQPTAAGAGVVGQSVFGPPIPPTVVQGAANITPAVGAPPMQAGVGGDWIMGGAPPGMAPVAPTPIVPIPPQYGEYNYIPSGTGVK